MRISGVILTLFCIVSMTCIISIGCEKRSEKETGNADNTAIEEKVFEVKTVHVELMDVDYSLDAVGSLLPNDDVTRSSEVTGTVEKTFVDEGDRVKKGDILLKISDETIKLRVEESRSFMREAEAALEKLMAWTRKERIKQVKANLDQVRINLENITKDYKRYKELYEGGVVDKSTYDTIDAKLKIAKKKVLTAEEEYQIALSGPTKEEIDLAKAKVDRARVGLRLAEKNLKDTQISSPIPGIVSKRMVSVGEYVKTGTELFIIVQDDPLKLSFSISEKYAGDVRIGQTVIAAVKAFPDERFFGEVYYISPESDKSTRSLEIKAKISNKENKLKPGFFADVALVISVKKNAMILPEEAILLIAGKPAIYIVRDGKALLDRIEIGRRFNGKVEVISSKLKSNDTVVTEGQGNLVDNALVRVTKES